MGLCHDFGSQIAERCNHPIRAGANACTCDVCGVVCPGLFDACSDVWAACPRPVLLTGRPLADEVLAAPPAPDPFPPPVPVDHRSNGADAVPATASEASRTEVFRWFEREFGALRDEVAGLRAALALERPATPGGGVQMEDLAAVVDEAVAMAVVNHLAVLEHSVAGALKSLRREMKEARLANERSVLALRDAIAESTALPASQLAPLAEAVADSAAHSESLLTGLAEAVADSASQSAAELAALRRRLDRVAHAQAPATKASGGTARSGPTGGIRISIRDHDRSEPPLPVSLADSD